MAADVRVRHCRLRIARRGGWSWGPDPRALLRGVLLRLPQLLAARLGEAWPDGMQAVLQQPVRLRVAVTPHELAALAAAGSMEVGSPASAATPAILRRIDAQLQAWAAGVNLPPMSEMVATPLLRAPGGASATTIDRDPWGSAVLSVLAAWHARGVLLAQLLAFSEAALADWHAALLQADAPARGDAAVAPSPEGIAGLAAEAAASVLPLPASPRATLVRRIACMVQAADELGLSGGDPRLLEAMAAQAVLVLAEKREAAEPGTDASHDASYSAETRGEPARLPARRTAEVAPAGVLRSTRSAEVDVACALPFLLLGPLSRTGYLLALRATCEAAGIGALLPAIARALAHKVLAPPRRGWLHDPRVVAAAQALAGGEESADGELAELARQLAPCLAPLDATVADVLARGHERGRPLVLREAPGGGWLLLDADGLFVIAWAERVERLFARLAPWRDEVLLLPEAPGAAAAKTALHDTGFRFVRDALPAERQLEDVGTQVDAVWKALAIERPGLPTSTAPAVERSLALAAALGAGTIAWTLWHAREPVTPLLALERFADFGARVRFREEAVEVKLPLGRRFLDLEAVGLLADVADVPWFGGRPLRFARG
jgi:hypothetical protein